MVVSGTLIHGTLRSEDLVPAFLDAVPVHVRLRVKNDYWRALSHLDQGEDFLTEEDRDDLAYLANEVLPDQLDLVAPLGTYFGSHPGDGSDFGFWPIEDDY